MLAEIDEVSAALQDQTLTECDAACIFDHPPISMKQFQQKIQEMPAPLQEAGIVFTEQLLSIKPLQIPLQAVNYAIRCQPPKHVPSVFMEILRKVASDPPCCKVVSKQGEPALPEVVFEQALCGVAVCKISHFVTCLCLVVTGVIILAHCF